jgi:orotidine-5'-phosphate decarboxylase
LVALDVDNLPDALRLVEELREHVRGFKVGLELCTNIGVQTAIAAISAAGGELFVDLKLVDIPNTVAAAARAVARPGVYMFNVHCAGGTAMMRAAAEVAHAAPTRPLVLGVTLVTSLDETNLHDELDVPSALSEYVVHMARLAQGSGLDGVVCSAHEVSAVKAACGQDFVVVVPGVRPAWAEANDQKRMMTPAETVRAGANFVVVGRPITRPPAAIGSPADAARRIMDEIAAG